MYARYAMNECLQEMMQESGWYHGYITSSLLLGGGDFFIGDRDILKFPSKTHRMIGERKKNNERKVAKHQG